mmetsp:Transcript_10386/g.19087  ORF Transcript_10386/g.19087 Transcript_10386/m.19087 type:complete len:966 (+) Transcript_10386:169-3066(+)
MPSSTIGLAVFLLGASHTAAMGVLTVGRPMPWASSMPYLKYVREHGVLQFINKYNQVKDVRENVLMWGDEIEYCIVSFDRKNRVPRIKLNAAEVRDALNAKEASTLAEGCAWMPEYGSWMVEGTPGKPYAGYSNDLMRVERNMRLRRARLMAILGPDEATPTLSAFPLLGVGDDFFTTGHGDGQAGGYTGRSSSSWRALGNNPISESVSIPDACINPHPRFGALTQNIRSRRGSKVDIRIPLFRDTRTPEFDGWPVVDGSGNAVDRPGSSPSTANAATATNGERADGRAGVNGAGLGPAAPAGAPAGASPAAKAKAWPHVAEMDAMAFGMGCCCLQVTFQARDVDESRYMFDQLAVLAPLFLALTAATPVLKGRVVDTDTRWACIAQSVDDRTALERATGVKSTRVAGPPASSATASNGNGNGNGGGGGGGAKAEVEAAAAGNSAEGSEWLSTISSESGCMTFTDTILPATADTQTAASSTSAAAASAAASTSSDIGSTTGVGKNTGNKSLMAGGGATRLAKSRYGSVSGYIYCEPSAAAADAAALTGKSTTTRQHLVDEYNDLPRELDGWSLETLLARGVDLPLAQHVSHLFVRDPLVCFEGMVTEVDDETETQHFENIQSTNWQTMRWKPPPAAAAPAALKSNGNEGDGKKSGSEAEEESSGGVAGSSENKAGSIGWRTEFRPMEVQVTDFENAAFSVLIVLVTRVILAYDLHLYIPLSLVEENMVRAQQRDAVLNQKFWFRKDIAPPQKGSDSVYNPTATDTNDNAESGGGGDGGASSNGGVDLSQYEEMTALEVLTGKEGGYYPGLLPLVYEYLEQIKVDPLVKAKVHRYLELVELRAEGTLPTCARWLRDMVAAHPEYEHDSVVGSGVAFDLLDHCRKVGDGSVQAPELIGAGNAIKPIFPEAAYDVPLDASLIGSPPRNRDLIAAYTNRATHRTMVGATASETTTTPATAVAAATTANA